MSKTVSVAALYRSYRGERVLASLLGLVALAGGAIALVVGQGWLGTFRATRPLVDPIAVDYLHQYQLTARIAALVVGVLVFVLGLLWFVRSLRPERKPDLELDTGIGTGLVVTSGAIADAVRADAEQIDGVGRARVRAVGNRAHPALRLNLSLRDGADLRVVWQQLDSTVLQRARESLGVDTLPTAVRMELGAAQRKRVQ